MELHGWGRGHSKHASIQRRICWIALVVCVLLLLTVAALRSFIGDSLEPTPALSIQLPAGAANDWNAQTVASWFSIEAHKSTFWETLLALPLSIGWEIHHQPIWGLPVLFLGAIIILGLWRFAAHILGMRKPSVFFPALIALQCAALGWGWSFYSGAPYRLGTTLSVVNMKSTFASILTAEEKLRWHETNGYTGLVVSKAQMEHYNRQYPMLLFVSPQAAQRYQTQLSATANWWLFPQDTHTESELEKHWESGKVATVTLANPPVSAWNRLPVASLINAFLSLLSILLIAILWGLQPPPPQLSAPGRITGFLEKRRRFKRWGGLIMMALSFVGTLFAIWLTFYPVWGFVRMEAIPLTTTALLFITLDYCFWLGRKSWKKKH